MKINLREASTKRGLVMTITGGIVLYQTVFGSGSANVDALLEKVEWWLGIGITLAGLLGVALPDDPKQPALPPIDLQARPESAGTVSDRVRVDLPAESKTESKTESTGFNG